MSIKTLTFLLISIDSFALHFCSMHKISSSPMIFSRELNSNSISGPSLNPASSIKRLARDTSNSNEQKDSTDDLVNLSGDFYLPRNYTKIHSPNHEQSGSPLEVTFEIHDLDIIEVNDIDYTMTVKMFLGVRWEDSRIIHRGNSDGDTQIPLDLILTKKLWTPDLDIYYLKEVEDFEVLKKDLAGKK